MNINELARRIYEGNKARGFHAKRRPVPETVALIHSEASELLEEWRDGRGPKEVYIRVKMTGREPEGWRELFRVINGQLHVRNEDYDNQQGRRDPSIPEYLEFGIELWRRMPNIKQYAKPEGIPYELADIIIRCLDFAGSEGIDIEAAITDKLAYNETRPHLHGRTH